MSQNDYIAMSATISDCRRYRYSLGRRWENGPLACFIMLNPSTADADIDDPTIRRCRTFAQRSGCGGLVVSNLFAWRTTIPGELAKVIDPIGPDTDLMMASCIARARDTGGPVIAAWEAFPWAKKRAMSVMTWLGDVYCLGKTRSGAPRHPLYVKGDQPLVPFVMT